MTISPTTRIKFVYSQLFIHEFIAVLNILINLVNYLPLDHQSSEN